MKIDYKTKFATIAAQTNYNNLHVNEQNFIKQKAYMYSFTLSEFKILVDIATDLHIWDEGTLSAIWEDQNTKKLTLLHVKQKYENIRDKTKSYKNFTPSKANKNRPINFTCNSDDKFPFGLCPVASVATRCCNLMTLDLIEGCGFDCSYCSISSFYAQDTIAFNLGTINKLKTLKLDPNQTYHIGTGQSSDSLLFGNKNGVLDALFAFAKDNPNAIIELKTKSANIDYLIQNPIPKNIITTWTINTPTIIKSEERGSASLDERLKSAKQIAQKGNLVGFHFHPMVVYENHKNDYQKIVQKIMQNFDPLHVACVSFGTLTFIKPLIKKIRKRALKSKILQMPLENANGKLSYPLHVKKGLFTDIYKAFLPWHDKLFFYLCMEEISLWHTVFGFEYADNEAFENAMKKAYFDKIDNLS